MGRAVSRKANAAERQIKLALFICEQGPVTRQQIQAKLPEYALKDAGDEAGAKRADATSRKRLERDRAALADAGIFIETTDNDAYRIAAGSGNNILAQLEAGSPQASLLRVAGAALLQDPAFVQANSLRMAMAKLSGPLEIPDALYWTEEDSLESLRSAGNVAEGTRRKVHSALSNCKVLNFEYISVSGTTSKRSVEPIGVYAFKGREYLAAWDIDKTDTRSFRLDRMKRLSVHENGRGKPDYEPRAFSPKDWQLLPFQVGVENVVDAKVSVAPSALWQARNLCSSYGELVSDEIGRTSWHVTCTDARGLAAWCIANGPGLVPSFPQEAADAYKRLVSDACVWADGEYVAEAAQSQVVEYSDVEEAAQDSSGELTAFANSLAQAYALSPDIAGAGSGSELTDNDILFAVLSLLEEAGAVSIPQTAQLLDVSEETVYRALETLAFCYDSAANTRLNLGEFGCAYAMLEHPVGLHLSLNADQAAAIAAAAAYFTTSALIGTITAVCGDEATQPLQISYWKEGEAAPQDRIVEPQGMVAREGRAYLQAWCRSASASRLFRLDRIIGAKVLSPEDMGIIAKTGGEQRKPKKAFIGLAAGSAVPDWPGLTKSKKPPVDNSVTFSVPWYGGPWLSKHLASLGGEVLRIEPQALASATGEYARTLLEQLAEE